MKNHIACKFAAIALAALFLLGAVLCTAAIGGLSLLDLAPGETIQQLRQQELRNAHENAAHTALRLYASIRLGGTPEEMASDLLEPLDCSAYRISDSAGVEVAEYGNPEGLTEYSYTLTDVQYIQVLGSQAEYTHSAESNETSQAGKTAAVGTDGNTESTRQGAEINSRVPEENNTYSYTDENGVIQTITYRMVRSGAYQVTIYVDESYSTNYYIWEITEAAYTHRQQVVAGLGVCLLCFALLAVYLCCTAGHKPGTSEIQPGGLNRMPLDLYAALIGCYIFMVVFLIFSYIGHILSLETTLAFAIIGYTGYSCALLVVGFCFAFAAQVKMPGTYWWNNSVLGRICGLLLSLLRKIPDVLRWVWSIVLRLFRAGEKLVLWCVDLVRKAFAAGKRRLQALCRGIGNLFSRLPLVWQWVVGIPLLFLIMLAGIRSASPAGILVRIGIVLLATGYIASSFGKLAAGADWMRSGELERKIDTRTLIGCFRQLADSLNGLSDTAMVTAQKQMKSERMRTELITNVSHDIKTPLTSIINYVDLLQVPHTPEQEKAWLEVLSRQSARMKKLIDDLMEMSKAASGALPVEVIRLDAGETVSQALGEFSDKLDTARLTPVFHEPESQVFMMADGRLAWRAMSNLLSNAVKYALPGTRLYIDLCSVADDVVISFKNVSREPLNISADELMERFVRGDISRNSEGSGLGLNIAKSLMELQNGQLQLLVDGDLFKATLIFPGTK